MNFIIIISDHQDMLPHPSHWLNVKTKSQGTKHCLFFPLIKQKKKFEPLMEESFWLYLLLRFLNSHRLLHVNFDEEPERRRGYQHRLEEEPERHI